MGAQEPISANSRRVYDCYSVDANAMIMLRFMVPPDIAADMWTEIERLAAEERWLVSQPVADEIKGDDWLGPWLRRNPGAVAPFDERFSDYANSFTLELDQRGIRMVNLDTRRNNADPAVVTLALMQEGRSLDNLHDGPARARCCVVTNEKDDPNKVNIPFVCRHFGLDFLNLHGFMRHHGWEITLTVRHPV